MRWRTALGREVVDTSTAEGVGEVDTMVVDAEVSSIVAFVVGDQVLSWTDATGIGADAVTIETRELLHDPRSELEQGAVDGKRDPLSKQVLTEDGSDLGTIADIDFDSETGAIRRLILGDDQIAGSRLLGVGSFAVMVCSTDRATSRGDIESLTKAELYEMAKARDIDGRSTMNKDELIAAVR